MASMVKTCWPGRGRSRSLRVQAAGRSSVTAARSARHRPDGAEAQAAPDAVSQLGGHGANWFELNSTRGAGPDREGALRGGGAARQQEDRRAAAGLADCQERNLERLEKARKELDEASRELLVALNLQGSATDSL